MTYDDITEATRQTLADFAESRRVLDLEEINGTGFGSGRDQRHPRVYP